MSDDKRTIPCFHCLQRMSSTCIRKTLHQMVHNLSPTDWYVLFLVFFSSVALKCLLYNPPQEPCQYGVLNLPDKWC
ncbi:hypothetical protein PVAP13_1NG191219 [Panicum virgatum]|uniref:Uncharacterized protein n=1 Tax=Panicum virgatum TaxID=38727 RepID=A0A8T0WSX7_PANVG|nr:hypothetical protein PVAP13_1NG191219 [Panicum virgatum]